jgi:L-ascorbate metabolism protein UlaG (beta-lactamase superfamily)
LFRFLKYVGAIVALILVVGLVLAWISSDHYRAFGGSPDPAQNLRLRQSPQFASGRFQNPEPTELMSKGSAVAAMLKFLTGDEMRVPICPLPVVTDVAARLAVPPASGLRVTWLGHSTTIIEIDGVRLLTDPIWSDRASPSTWVGPRRFHPPPLALADLPPVDAVLISHEHYDHLDMNTVRTLAPRGVVFHVPLGVGAHLTAWGVPAAQIVEHDWWEATPLPHGVRLTSTPARHFNGRGVPWRTGALWTSWSIVGPRHRVFFSGDTGLTESLREVARREGPFDLAMIEIGQYHTSWGSIHLGPEGALQAHAWLGARTLLPIHWSTFELAYHAWSEPAEALVQAAAKTGVALLTPRPGEPVEPTTASGPTPWWRRLPPQTSGCPGY